MKWYIRVKHYELGTETNIRFKTKKEAMESFNRFVNTWDYGNNCLAITNDNVKVYVNNNLAVEIELYKA